jgi:hypothetical protein
MYELALLKDPPLRVVIGSDAYHGIMGRLKEYGENYKKYKRPPTALIFMGIISRSNLAPCT